MKLENRTESSGTWGGGEDRTASLFQPDVLLSDQFFENFRRSTPLAPEKTLMLAVLEDGIRCYQDNLLAESGKKRKLFEDAEQWLFDDDTHWVFSFVSICRALNLEPGYIRRGLLQWKAQALKKAGKSRDRAAQQRLVA